MTNKQQNILFNIMRTLIAILISLAVVVLIIFIISKEPMNALNSFLTGPFSSTRRIGNVIESTIPLIFTGLAACVMFQAKQFSMIGDGAFFFGSLMATTFILNIPLPAGVSPVVTILLGGIVGGLCGIIPGVLKAKWNTNEFVVSMMFNSVLTYLGLYVLFNYIRDPKSGFVASYRIPEEAKLSVIAEGTKVHSGIIIALVMTLLVYIFLYKTKFGYAIRMVGINKKFAQYSGINTFAVILMCQVIGGFIAGIGGTTEVLGMYPRFQWTDSPGLGFDGLTVSILAGYNPALVPLCALFMAYLRVGTDVMARMSDVPSEVVSIIQGVVMLLVTATAFLANVKHRMVVNSSKKALIKPVTEKGA